MIRYNLAKPIPPYYPMVKSSIDIRDHTRIFELTTRLRKQDNKGLWRDVYFLKKMTLRVGENTSQNQAAELLHQQLHIEVYNFIIQGKIEHPVLSDIGSMFPESDTQEPEEDRLKKQLGL